MKIEIIRAAKIIHAMKIAHQSEKGAIGLDGEMIDAPMIKQVSSACRAPTPLLTLPGGKYDKGCTVCRIVHTRILEYHLYDIILSSRAPAAAAQPPERGASHQETVLCS